MYRIHDDNFVCKCADKVKFIFKSGSKHISPVTNARIRENWIDVRDPKDCEIHEPVAMKCNVCNHMFVTYLHYLFSGNWCKYCHIQLCGDERCDTCRRKSFGFAHPLYISYWSKDNILSPYQIRADSDVKIMLDCPRCRYQTVISPHHIRNALFSCRHCKGQILCDKQDSCEICINSKRRKM